MWIFYLITYDYEWLGAFFFGYSQYLIDSNVFSAGSHSHNSLMRCSS